MKTFTWGGMFVGSAIGGWLPTLWGDSVFSFSSALLTFVGGVLGVFAGWKLGQMMGL